MVSAFLEKWKHLEQQEPGLVRNKLEEESFSGYKPIFYAARSGNPEVVKILLDSGAKPKGVGRLGTGDARDENDFLLCFNYTALHQAIIAEKNEVCRFLITYLKGGLTKDGWSHTYLEATDLDKPEDPNKAPKSPEHDHEFKEYKPENNICDPTALAFSVIKNPEIALFILDNVLRSSPKRECFTAAVSPTPFSHLLLFSVAFREEIRRCVF